MYRLLDLFFIIDGFFKQVHLFNFTLHTWRKKNV